MLLIWYNVLARKENTKMIEDKNGKITIEYKDVYNFPLRGDFETIPKGIIMAIITETLYNEETLNTTTYRIILGNPIYKTDDVVIANNITNINTLEKPVIVVGNSCHLDYFAFPKENDIIVTTSEEMTKTIQEIGAKFLEKLDAVDDAKKILSKK